MSDETNPINPSTDPANETSAALTEIDLLAIEVTKLINKVVTGFLSGDSDGREVAVAIAQFAKEAEVAKTIYQTTDANSKIAVTYENIIDTVKSIISEARVNDTQAGNGVIVENVQLALETLSKNIKSEILGSTTEELDSFKELKDMISASEGSLPLLLERLSKGLGESKEYTDGKFRAHDTAYAQNESLRNTEISQINGKITANTANIETNRQKIASHETEITKTLPDSITAERNRAVGIEGDLQSEINKLNAALTANKAAITKATTKITSSNPFGSLPMKG